MEPQLYLEYETDLQVAKAEEYIGREYARTWYEQSISELDWNNQPKEPWAGQPAAYDWIVVKENPYYPQPPDTGPIPIARESFQPYYCRATKKSGGGGVITMLDEILVWTQTQTLSDGTTYSIDYQADMVPFEELSSEGQLAINPPP